MFNVENLDRNSHVAVNNKDSELLSPTVEVHTAHDLVDFTSTSVMGRAGNSPYDPIKNLFTDYAPITSVGVNQYRENFLAFGRFGRYGQGFGTFDELRANPEFRYLSPMHIRANAAEFGLNEGLENTARNRHRMLLVEARINDFEGLNSKQLSTIYVNPITLHACHDNDAGVQVSINNEEAITTFGGVVTNKVEDNAVKVRYDNSIFNEAISKDYKPSELRGEIYTNDIFLSSIYSKPYIHTANRSIFVPVGDSCISPTGSTYSDVA